jgi:hypothetical protein
MSETKDARPTLPGLYDRAVSEAAAGINIAAVAATVVWLGLSGAYVFFGGGGEAGSGPGPLLLLLVVALPIALIWVAALSLRAVRVMQAESTRLQAAVDALRQAYVAQAQAGKGQPPSPQLLKRLDELASGQKNIEATLAMLGGVRQGAMTSSAPPQQGAAHSVVANGADDQPTLSLGTPAEALQPPLARADYIRALHFPETAEDTEGFAALRRALKHRDTAKLIQAAQDVLTLMSQDGIYMDDLRPDMARPEVWRAFAKGERGRAIAALGGVHDRFAGTGGGADARGPDLSRCCASFPAPLRQQLATFEPDATDEEISAFAMTRTARAFMLLGRVAGTFD